MDVIGQVLLAIVGMLAWIGCWIWLGLFGLPIGGRAIDPISAYVRRKWFSWSQWRRKPQNEATALKWTVRAGAMAIIIFAYNLTPDDHDDLTSWLDPYQAEIVGIAFAVLVIEEIGRRQSRLDFKESIIQQMASRSNDFALDAARVAKSEGWLEDGSLQGASLVDANLQGADLVRAKLKDSALHRIRLQDALLLEADLQSAVLHQANLQGASLHGANLQGVFLLNADLQGADLQKANLQDAILVNANLESTRLRGANLQGAFLNGANLQDAILHGVNLQGAFLVDANLKSASLRGANLQGAELWDAKYNMKTQWPKGFNPKAHPLSLTPD